MLAVRLILVGAIMGLIMVGTWEGVVAGAFLLPFLELCFGRMGLSELEGNGD